MLLVSGSFPGFPVWARCPWPSLVGISTLFHSREHSWHSHLRLVFSTRRWAPWSQGWAHPHIPVPGTRTHTQEAKWKNDDWNHALAAPISAICSYHQALWRSGCITPLPSCPHRPLCSCPAHALTTSWLDYCGSAWSPLDLSLQQSIL